MKQIFSLFTLAALGLSTPLYAQEATTPTVVKAGQIANAPAQYYGKSVSVTAEVERVHSPQVFTLDEDKVFAGPDVLVIAPRVTTVKDNTKVTVTGKVRKFVRAEIEREFNWFGRGVELDAEIEKRAVIIADSIKTADGKELLSATTATPEKTKP